MKIIVFDLGGTLMEYSGMPYSWVDYYQQGFEQIAFDNNYCPSKVDVEKSIEIMKSFNARIVYREIEYAPEHIMESVLKHWGIDFSIGDAINSFFEGMKLVAHIYNDTISTLEKLKEQGYILAALTDLPTAMPDSFFKKDILELLNYIDFYVSSLSCGYRKPNKAGLQLIADTYIVDIKDLLFVGDEEKDRLTAKNANCKFLQISRDSNNSAVEIHSLMEITENNGKL